MKFAFLFNLENQQARRTFSSNKK